MGGEVAYNPVEYLLGLNLYQNFDARYIIKRKLGHGSYGQVHLVSPILYPEDEYAVKIIDRTKIKKKDDDAVFREVSILRQLQDVPNVIPLIDFLVEPTKLFVVLTFAGGGDLFDKLADKKIYTEKDARDIAIALLETCHHMHTTHQIVHRDLKPQNLLLKGTSQNNQTMIYVADFGFAKQLNNQNGYFLQTRCGTPSFVAPEIVLGLQYRQPIDMWSVGCILYMLVGGYPPFQGEDHMDLFRKIRASDFCFHESKWANASTEVKRLIAGLLTVDPRLRLTAHQALSTSEWIHKLNEESLSNRDLSLSLTEMKKFKGRQSLKGAIHAVKWASTAKFWNSDTITFSRQQHSSRKFWDQYLIKESLDTISVDSTSILAEASQSSNPSEMLIESQPSLPGLAIIYKQPKRITFADNYKLTRKIRKGSCATIWECFHSTTQKQLAVKVIKRSKLKLSDDEMVLNEVAMMQSLSAYSKYIAQLLDFYEEKDYFFLVMDYMGGGDVFDRILARKRFTEHDARLLTKILLKACACMHQAGIAHRDLKPQNLLLTSKDDDAHIKVTDFGFARRVHTPQSLTSRCGTPTFVAPEILKNIPHDERVDLWSVGIIIHCVLVGYPPFMHEQQSELFRQIRTGDWDFYRPDWQHISTQAQDLICGLLCVDPQHRWTVQEALNCDWIQQLSTLAGDRDESIDLTQSWQEIRNRRCALRAFQYERPVIFKKGNVLSNSILETLLPQHHGGGLSLSPTTSSSIAASTTSSQIMSVDDNH